MKTLVLLRHAKAGRDPADQRDFDRTLTERGIGDIRRIAGLMRTLRLTPPLILCSPSRRTRQTCDEYQAIAGGDPTVRYVDDIYLASAESLLTIVQAATEDVACLMLIGHNPGFEDLAQILLPAARADDSQELRILRQHIPTAGLVELTFNLPLWRDIIAGSARLVHFITPKVSAG